MPGGLPSFGFPSGLSWSDVTDLLPTAVSIFVVILAQSAATSRAYAAKYDERSDENTDLVGLGAGRTSRRRSSGTFVVNGSPTKTQMVDSAGGRSQLAQLTAGAIVRRRAAVPDRAAAVHAERRAGVVVFLIAIELIDIAGMRRVLARPARRVRRRR